MDRFFCVYALCFLFSTILTDATDWSLLRMAAREDFAIVRGNSTLQKRYKAWEKLG